MSLLKIPLRDLPDQSFTVVLDTIAYDIRVQWNGRDESWYVYFGRANQQYLFKTKITNGTDVLRKYRAYDDCPKGILMVLDQEKLYGRLQRDSFNSGRFALLYYTEESANLIREAGLIN